MSHLIVLYYFFAILAGVGGLAVLGFAFHRTKDPLTGRIVFFLLFLFFHVFATTLNFYISAVAGAGFDNPVVQVVYVAVLVVLFGILINMVPWFGHTLVDRPWQGPVRWIFLALSLTGTLCFLWPLVSNAGAPYLPALWGVVYGGYVNLVWAALVYFLVILFLGRGRLVPGPRRRYAVVLILLCLTFLPGLLMDQFWKTAQLAWKWIPRGFTFEPLFFLAVLGASLWFRLRKPAPWRALYAGAQKTLQSKYGLSTREWEVLEFAVEGWSNLQISESLCIAEGTVKSHVHSILEKTGLRSRWELAKLIRG